MGDVKIFTLVLINEVKMSESEIWELTMSHFDSQEYHGTNLLADLSKIEKDRIKSALIYNKGNRTRAAKELGIGRTLLLHKIKKYDLLD